MEYLNPWVGALLASTYHLKNWLPWGKAADIADVETRMAQATTYKEWRQWAEQLDVLKGLFLQWFLIASGNVEWKKDPESDFYDWRLIEERLSALR